MNEIKRKPNLIETGIFDQLSVITKLTEGMTENQNFF